jgi:hypothetical protein
VTIVGASSTLVDVFAVKSRSGVTDVAFAGEGTRSVVAGRSDVARASDTLVDVVAANTVAGVARVADAVLVHIVATTVGRTILGCTEHCGFTADSVSRVAGIAFASERARSVCACSDPGAVIVSVRAFVDVVAN